MMVMLILLLALQRRGRTLFHVAGSYSIPRQKRSERLNAQTIDDTLFRVVI